MKQIKESIQSVEQNINEIISIVKTLDEKTIRWNPTEEEWSIMQIIVHITEAIPFWLTEIEKIKEDPTVTWGRGLSHEGRLYAVSEDNINSMTVEQAINDLEKIPEIVKNTVESLNNEQLQVIAPCRNPNFDGKPVQFIVDNLVVKHIEGHFGQVNRNLSKI